MLPPVEVIPTLVQLDAIAAAVRIPYGRVSFPGLGKVVVLCGTDSPYLAEWIANVLATFANVERITRGACPEPKEKTDDPR